MVDTFTETMTTEQLFESWIGAVHPHVDAAKLLQLRMAFEAGLLTGQLRNAEETLTFVNETQKMTKNYLDRQRNLV